MLRVSRDQRLFGGSAAIFAQISQQCLLACGLAGGMIVGIFVVFLSLLFGFVLRSILPGFSVTSQAARTWCEMEYISRRASLRSSKPDVAFDPAAYCPSAVSCFHEQNVTAAMYYRPCELRQRKRLLQVLKCHGCFALLLAHFFNRRAHAREKLVTERTIP